MVASIFVMANAYCSAKACNLCYEMISSLEATQNVNILNFRNNFKILLAWYFLKIKQCTV